MTTVSTNNWDTAFGIKFKDANAAIAFKDANAAIASDRSSPASFSGSHHTIGATYQVAADFGTWQMTGGSGSLLMMTLPLVHGRITGGGQPNADFTASAKIEVRLGFIPQPGSDATRSLELDTSQAVTVLEVKLTQGPDDTACDAIKGALQDWLNTNLDEFNHVFATVDLNTRFDGSGDDSFSWVRPTHLGYAIHTENIASSDDYIFGVLAMTENRPGRNLSPVIDPGIIPESSDAGFLIAAPRVIEKMFAPHIETLFADALPGDFDARDDGMTLINVKKLTLSHLTLADGSVIDDAEIDAAGFSLSIGNGFVEIEFTGLKFTWEGKYDVSVNYRSVNTLGTDANGHLQLEQTTVPTVSITTAETSEEKWKEIWESIGISVGVAVIGACVGAAVEAGVASAAARSAAAEAIVANGGVMEIELADFSISPVRRLAARVDELNSAVDSLRAPAAPQSFSGLFRATAWKLLGLAIGAGIGAGISGIVTALQAYSEENTEKMPTLDNFTSEATKDVNWGGSSGYRLSSAHLRGAFQLGLKKEA
jgi:hypothetical protein